MPEGDTIWRTARTLGDALVGKEVTALSSPLPRVAAAARRLCIEGTQIEAVEPRGKHLLIRFSNGAVLRTHMQMTGSWHLYRFGSRWRQAPHLARVVIRAGEVVAVCFAAPIVELVSAGAAESAVSHLGPDLLAEQFDETHALARLRVLARQEIAVALLDQTALAGVGNVYKNEVLFLHGVNPFVHVQDLTDPVLLDLIRTARRELRRNVDTSLRRTTPDQSPRHLWVYSRAGQPCTRCHTRIVSRRQGEQARVTYWCPKCQPPHAQRRDQLPDN